MPEEWSGDLVKKMHMNRINHAELAEEAGFSKSYVGMILNGKRSTPGARLKLETAVDNIIARRKEKGYVH